MITKRNENVQNCLSFDWKKNKNVLKGNVVCINKKETNDACLFVGQKLQNICSRK